MNINEFRRNSAIAMSAGRILIGYPFAIGKGLMDLLRSKCIGKHGETLVDDIEFKRVLMLPTAHLVERARQTLESAQRVGAEDLDEMIDDLNEFVELLKTGDLY